MSLIGRIIGCKVTRRGATARRVAAVLAWSLALGACTRGGLAEAANFLYVPDCAGRGAAAHGDGAAPTFEWTVLPRVENNLVPGAYKIAVIGDSLTSARNFIDAALQVAGVARTAVLPSFIQAGMGVKGLSLPLKSSCASGGWQTAYAYREKAGSAPAFSKGALSMTSRNPGDSIVMDFRSPLASTRVRQIDIVYTKARPDDSLLLGVTLDGGDERLVSLRRAAGGVLRIVPSQPVATLKVRLVSGAVTIHGFQPVYQDAPAVQLDSLSVPGSTIQGWSHVDARFFPERTGPNYDLIVVEYGTNEGAAPAFDRDSYLRFLRIHLGRLRAFYPDTPCILVGPPDRGAAASPGSPKYSTIHRQIAIAQRQVSAEYRCGFWDWQAMMGGPGSALEWARMNPPLEQPDLTHMTARGYERSGRMFGEFFPLKKK